MATYTHAVLIFQGSVSPDFLCIHLIVSFITKATN